MYSHPLLHPRDHPRKILPGYRPPNESAPPRERKSLVPPASEPRRRTLDEKLDEALKLTFPASDAFFVG